MSDVIELMTEAESFCYWWKYIPIWKVEESTQYQGGCWVTDGKRAHLEVKFGADRGLLAHECFHSAFDRSPLHAYSESWGEGFCNAFAYFMSGRGRPDTGTNFSYTTNYVIPFQLILDACDADYVKFRSLWWRWNADAERIGQKGYLDSRLGFVPGWGYLHAREQYEG